MDLNGDGHRDILSGSWPGEIFFFEGRADRSFAAPEMLKDKDGELINIGGGIEERSNGEGLLIKGTAEWETTDTRTFITYRGKRYESTPERPIATTGTASVVSAADWDGDGDYDLIVGTIGGDVYLVPNEGTAQSHLFGRERQLQAGGRPLHVQSRAGPCVADWDGDGDLDLLVGQENGSVSLYRNVGSAKAPELTAALQLVPPGERRSGSQVPKEPRRGNRSKVCVADWNGDGRLDLLVGDVTSQKPDLPEPTAEEKVKHDQIRKELEPLQKRYGELIQKLMGPSRVRDKEEVNKVHEEMRRVNEQMQPLRAQLPRESETHGWVWLFLRQ